MILEQEIATIQTQESVAVISLKKEKLTEVEQKNILIEMISPHAEISGNTIAVNLPTGLHALKPCRNQDDIVKMWVFDQYHKLHGRNPLLQSYKAACNAITVSLRADQMAELEELQKYAPISDDETCKSPSNNFVKAERVDGHDNLYIFTLRNGKGTIGRLKTKYDKNTDTETEEMTPLWGPDTFPAVHEVLDVEDAAEGTQTHYDVTIAGRRHTLPLETFKSGNWYDYFPGITGVLDSSKEKSYKAAMMQVASKAPRVAAFETTGLKKIVTAKGTDEWVFVLPDGRFITRSGADLSTFKVRMVHDILTPQEKRVWEGFQLPTELPSKDKRQAAYNYVRDIASRGQGLVILSHMIGASLYDMRDANFGPTHSLIVKAPPGAGKTTLSGFARSIIYPFQGEKPTPDASFQDTVTSIEDDLTYRSSMPVIVDDLVIQGASETKKKEMGTSLDAFSRASFNVKPMRKRMRSSRSGLKKQRANYVLTLPTVTVEGIPEVPKSWYRRVLIVEIEGAEIVKEAMGRTDVVSLDQMGQYASTLQGWGHIGIIQFFLERLVAEGLDRITKKFEALHRQAIKDIQEAVIAKWDSEQQGNKLPDDWNSIGKSAAYDLFYFRLFRMVACRDIETSDSDIFPHLVDIVYRQMLHMEGRIQDEEGLFTFEKAVLSFFEEIKAGRIENSQRWRVDHKVTATGPIEPPQVWYPNKKGKFPFDFWGWTPDMVGLDDSSESEDGNEKYKPRPRESFPIAYIDDTTIYVTERARKELLKIVQKLPEGEGVTSEKALGELAEKEGWITKRESSKSRALKIVPPQGPTRVWALSLAKFLAHYQDISEEEISSTDDRPENVSDFTRKTELDEEVHEDF